MQGSAFLFSGLVNLPPYTKPYLPVADQIAKLIERGMIVEDPEKAAEYLSRIGYYRLSAYWYPFRRQAGGLVVDEFKPGSSFRTVLDLYSFDKRLRLQLLDVLERIEVFVRTGVALQLGQLDPLAHRNEALLDAKFTRPKPDTGRSLHDDWLANLDKKARQSKEEFAAHFRRKYAGSHMPIWIAVELLDFGPLSHFISGMKWADVLAISSSCAAPDRDVFASWIRSLSVVRNVCAHHARLWNKPLVDQPKLPRPGTIPLLDHVGQSPFGARRLYAACAIARYLLLLVNPRTQWSARLKEHVATFPESPHISVKTMGFPDGWQQLDLWK